MYTSTAVIAVMLTCYVHTILSQGNIINLHGQTTCRQKNKKRVYGASFKLHAIICSYFIAMIEWQ